MFCRKCGNQIPDDSKFCSRCGEPTLAENVQSQMSEAKDGKQKVSFEMTEKPAKAEKKKTPVWLGLLVVVVVFIIGKTVLAPMMVSDFNDTTTPESSENSNLVNIEISDENIESADDTAAMENSEYTDIFLSRSIVENPSTILMMDSECFAMVSDDGMIEKIEFGYEDDVVKIMVNTVYFPISEYTEDEKITFEANIKEAYAEVEALEFCTANYNMGNLYYCIIFTFENLDNVDNIQKIGELGLLNNTDGATYISMEKTEEGLLSAGYVKK